MITAGLAGILGLAIIATLVSKNAQTGNVLSQAGGALSQVITAATAPVTGNNAGALTSTNILGNSLGNYVSNPLGFGGISF